MLGRELEHTVAGAGDLTITQRMEWTSGTLGQGGGQLIVAAGATAEWSSGSTKYIDRVVQNSGELTYNGGDIRFNLNTNANGRIENLAGGTFIFQGLAQYAADLILLGALPLIFLALAANFVLTMLVATVERTRVP